MNREFLDSAIAAVLCFVGGCVVIAVMAIFGVLSGCTQHEVKVTAPQLDPVSDAIKKIVVKDCSPPKLAMPPLPDQARIIIKGTHLEADDNGIVLLRSYVKAREILKP